MSELKEFRARPPQLQKAKILNRFAWLITAIVLLLAGLMRRPELKIPLPDGVSLSFLPPIHAVLNSLVSIFLVVAVLAIKKGKVQLHYRFINGAMFCSVLFLLCYVAYHFTTTETLYGGLGWARYLYFFLLISHIVLAAISLPFILLTWIRGYSSQWKKHTRMARWVFPIWLYVALTGPICYLMLRPYY